MVTPVITAAQARCRHIWYSPYDQAQTEETDVYCAKCNLPRVLAPFPVQRVLQSGGLAERLFRAAQRIVLQQSSGHPAGHDACVELRAAVNAVRKACRLKPIHFRHSATAHDPGPMTAIEADAAHLP